MLDDSQEVYAVACAIDLLWAKIHIDNFEYSKELEEHYNTCQKGNEFSKALINNRFKMAIAEIIIMLHCEKRDCAKSAYDKALEIMSPEYKGELYSILKKHRYSETLEITDDAVEYLKRVQNILG